MQHSVSKIWKGDFFWQPLIVSVAVIVIGYTLVSFEKFSVSRSDELPYAMETGSFQLSENKTSLVPNIINRPLTP